MSIPRIVSYREALEKLVARYGHAEVADRLNLSKSTIYNHLRGDTTPLNKRFDFFRKVQELYEHATGSSDVIAFEKVVVLSDEFMQAAPKAGRSLALAQRALIQASQVVEMLEGLHYDKRTVTFNQIEHARNVVSDAIRRVVGFKEELETS